MGADRPLRYLLFKKTPMKPMKKILTSILLVFILFSNGRSQNYNCAASANPNGEVELSLLNYCGTEIQWQARDTSSSIWMDIPSATTNPFSYEASPQNIDGKVFRAMVKLSPDTISKYSYPFGIRLITEAADIQVSDFYDRSFVYFSLNETMLGSYFTDDNLNAIWGCYGDQIMGADATAVGSGKQNSLDILASCAEPNIAARVADNLIINGLDDWYLPAKDELDSILLVFKNNNIHQIQAQYGINAGNLNNSKRFWSSSESSDTHTFYNLIYGGGINLGGAIKKNSGLHILVSRDIDPANTLSSTCHAILIPFQFLDHISVEPVPDFPSAVAVNYLGVDAVGNNYQWNFDGGEVLSGSGAGPYIVQYENGLYKRVTMRFDHPSCNSPKFRSSVFKVKFFEKNPSVFPEIYDGCVRWGDFNNDDLLDVILSGSDTTNIYINDGQNYFVPLDIALPKLIDVHLSLGDFDNDQFLDFILCGMTSADSIPQTKLFRNIDGQVFTEVDVDLPPVKNGFAEWLDYNNDGMLDVLLSGVSTDGEAITQLFAGNRTGEFASVAAPFPPLINSFVAIDDYNKDGFIDIMLLGKNETERVSQIFRNNQGSFTATADTLIGIDQGEAIWTDFNQDGFLDLIYTGNKEDLISEVTGNSIFVSGSYACSLFLYENMGNDSFQLDGVDVSDFGFPHKSAMSSLDAADYNNDGYEDIVITGIPAINWAATGTGGGIPAIHYRSMVAILENNGQGSFTTNNVDLPSFWTGSSFGAKPAPTPPLSFECSSIRFGDYNNDGNVDVLREGRKEGYSSAVYENTSNNVNLPPLVPSNLQTQVTCDSILFSWNPSTDDHTPESSLTYEIYLGTSPNSGDIFSKKNIRKIRNTYFKLDSLLQDGIYYWGVKAIDNAKSNSSYSVEESFEISCTTATNDLDAKYSVHIYPNPFSDEFSISVTGTDEKVKYEIINNLGQVVTEGYMTNSISLSDNLMEPGIYYVQLVVDDKLISKIIIRSK